MNEYKPIIKVLKRCLYEGHYIYYICSDPIQLQHDNILDLFYSKKKHLITFTTRPLKNENCFSDNENFHLTQVKY